MAHRDVIDDNLSFLTKYTSASLPLLIALQTQKVITPDECDNVHRIQASTPKNVEFYKILQMKDFNAFKIAFGIMQERDTAQNEDILAIFRPIISAGENPTSLGQNSARSIPAPTRAITENGDVHWLTKMLADDTSVVEMRDVFYTSLGLKLSQLPALDRAASNAGRGGDSHFFRSCLTAWISAKSAAANFKTLDEKLRESEFIGVADKIKNDPRAQ